MECIFHCTIEDEEPDISQQPLSKQNKRAVPDGEKLRRSKRRKLNNTGKEL